MSDTKAKNPVIIYHGDCPDGFGAAWAAWKKFGDTALYIPVQHRSMPPAEIEGRDVFTIDYAYPAEVVEKEILPKAKSLTIIDHHVTAQGAVALAPGSVFDNDHSGAYLSWTYFHPGEPVPKLISYVEEGDLWKVSLPFSKEVNHVLNLRDFGFEEWSKLAQKLENPASFEEIVAQGTLLAEKMRKLVAKIVDNAEEIEFEGHKCLLANSPFYVSEVGAALVGKLPPMGIIWSRRKKRVVVSLRGDGTIDLTEIAKRYGGGGHRNAAAFSWDEEEFLEFKKPN